MQDQRLTIDQYYLKIAQAAALRSTCERAKVGCIIVNDNIVLGIGFNGSLSGQPHCKEDEKDCKFKGHCIRSTHAEINALHRVIIAGFNDKLKDATLYVTSTPCYACIKTLTAFGIRKIIYENIYEDEMRDAYCDLIGLKLIQVSNM